MSEFKGTPGPWRVDETKALGAYGVWTDVSDRLTENPLHICAVADINELTRPTIPREQRDANARLIAAAPDLLQALQQMIRVGSEYYDMDCGENGSAAIEQARAAIARATKGIE